MSGCLSIAAAPAVDLSTPERTIENYYRGYQTGNKGLVEATQIQGPAISDLGFGDTVSFKIVEKKMILYSNDHSVKPGDIEIIVQAEWKREKNAKADEAMISTFILGQYGKEWKIKGGYSVHPNRKPD
jgi:hypothetical protein